jgi:hypothetical protein
MAEFRFFPGSNISRLLIASLLVCGSIGVSSSRSQQPDEVLEIPKLRFLASSHPPQPDQSLPPAGNYWTPDGRMVNDEKDLALIHTVQDYRSESSPYLFLFFTHPDFHRPFALASIETDQGMPINSDVGEISVLIGNGVIALAVPLPNEVTLPEKGTVRLKYSLGDWTRVDTIPSNVDPAPYHYYDDASLLAIGESSSNLSFATLLLRDGLDSDFQYYVRATLDGTTLIDPGRRLTLYQPAYVQTFVFRKPLEEIQLFFVEKRMVNESVYSGVSLVATEVAE